MFEAITNTLMLIATKQRSSQNKFYFGNDISNSEKTHFLQNDLNDEEWTIDRSEVILLKKKIEEKGIKLKNWDIRINRGILTGFNEAFIINRTVRKKIIDETPSASNIIKPITRGRDISRYYHVDSEVYLINTHNGYRLDDNSKVEAVEINDYPSVKRHLNDYLKELSERQDKGDTIYNLRDCAFIEDFTREKIIWLELTNKNKFSYSAKEDYILAGAFLMVGESLKYLLAFLNSKLCYFYFSLICNSSGMATIQWKKFALEKVPVIKLSGEKQKPLINMVDEILSITKSTDYQTNETKQAKVKELEKQIDQMVYKLYDLTPEEIAIVEGHSKSD
jgi:hypothetical protein